MRFPHFVMWADRDIFMDYWAQNPHHVAHSEQLIMRFTELDKNENKIKTNKGKVKKKRKRLKMKLIVDRTLILWTIFL